MKKISKKTLLLSIAGILIFAVTLFLVVGETSSLHPVQAVVKWADTIMRKAFSSNTQPGERDITSGAETPSVEPTDEQTDTGTLTFQLLKNSQYVLNAGDLIAILESKKIPYDSYTTCMPDVPKGMVSELQSDQGSLDASTGIYTLDLASSNFVHVVISLGPLDVSFVKVSDIDGPTSQGFTDTLAQVEENFKAAGLKYIVEKQYSDVASIGSVLNIYSYTKGTFFYQPDGFYVKNDKSETYHICVCAGAPSAEDFVFLTQFVFENGAIYSTSTPAEITALLKSNGTPFRIVRMVPKPYVPAGRVYGITDGETTNVESGFYIRKHSTNPLMIYVSQGTFTEAYVSLSAVNAAQLPIATFDTIRTQLELLGTPCEVVYEFIEDQPIGVILSISCDEESAMLVKNDKLYLLRNTKQPVRMRVSKGALFVFYYQGTALSEANATALLESHGVPYSVSYSTSSTIASGQVIEVSIPGATEFDVNLSSGFLSISVNCKKTVLLVISSGPPVAFPTPTLEVSPTLEPT